jgi:predicted metalloendopeptidase
MLRKLSAAVFAALTLAGAAKAAFTPGNLDPSVRPQDDFYRYADGGWLKRTVIPPEYARWGSFDELSVRNQENLRVLCERASAQENQATPIEKMVGDFYASGLDVPDINAAESSPLEFEFTRISAIKSPEDVLVEIARLHRIGVPAGFSFESAADIKDSDREIAELGQGGLGLPERDYYFRDDEKSKKIREQYVEHVSRMLGLLGDAPAKAQADAAAVMKLETALAKGSLTLVVLRNPNASYHKMSLAAAEALAPGIDWPGYLHETSAPAFADLNFAHPDFFKAFSAALAQTPVAEWQVYLRWQLINAYAPYLSDNFAQEDFSFNGTILTGTKSMKPRWQRVVTTIDGSIGEALGQLYAAAYFPPEAKVRALKLVADLQAALRDRLQTLEWMDEPTRAKALAKLDAMTVKIGYPEKWRDYSSLVIDRGPYVLNVLKAKAFEVRRNLAKIGGPVDRTEWGMTPPTVNAYYRPTQNEIVFPAGILQPPFFDAKADDAVNYGAIGSVIGHEMTHGFDDRGRQFDAHGNLADWWTPESEARFKARSAAIVGQFNGYFPIPNVHINGELTQGENIADLGGLRIAYAALQKALAGQPRDKIGGFTPEQRFFLSFASIYAVKFTPEEALRRLRIDPHSPGEFRCNGPLSNMDEFANAFNVPEGAPMRRPAADRFTIW